MKKNLKKAISAVIALAVAGSMVPASLAAKVTLTDVLDTASYATAVNTLVALGVISGYPEDNTFRPDNLITRAEVTKVVVAALNQTAAAENMKGSTNFSDVAADFWGSGYINAGVQNGFINGRDDGTFDPQANVSYAEIVKMLVATMGYEQYADYMGGYPNGYIAIANSEGVTAGVNAKADDKVTRAQVAQLVYNAMNTPIVQESGFVQTETGIRPNVVKMDGTKNGSTEVTYKTLLTEYFDAYYLEGYVVGTKKSGASVEFDEVEFAVAKAEKYDLDEFDHDSGFTTKNNISDAAADVKWTVNVGDTDALAYEGVYASAIVMIDEYDDCHMISFMPSGKNKTVSFDATLLDTSDYEDANGDILANPFQNVSNVDRLAFFQSTTATKASEYRLYEDNTGDLSLTIYVNGVKVVEPVDGETAALEALSTYVVNNNVGKVELVDTFKTDNKYDTIFVSYYATAQVSSATASSGKVVFENNTLNATSITLDDEDEELEYHIYYNGEEITVAELKEDDVLSIAFDVTASNSGLKNSLIASKFYDIYVSREVKTGKLSGMNDSDEIVTIAGEQYSFVGDYDNQVADMVMSDEYTLYVDYFGRIYSYETNVSAAKYAILDRFTWNTSDEAYRAVLYTAEGTSKTYVFSNGTSSKVLKDGVLYADLDVDEDDTLGDTAEHGNAKDDAVWDLMYDGSTKKNIEERVIKYKVSSSTGELTYVEFLSAQATSGVVENGELVKKEFKAKNNTIGSVKLSDATKIVDAIEYMTTEKTVDFAMATIASLTDDTPYLSYAFGEKFSDGTYPFVIITAADGSYNESTRFAVVTGSATSSSTEAGDLVYEIPVLYKGEATTLTAIEDIEDEVNALNKGDVFFFLTDSNSYVDEIDVIFTTGGTISYKNLVEKSIVENNDTVLVGPNKLVRYPSSDKASEDFEEAWFTNKADAIQLVYGPVMEKANSYMSIGKVIKEDGRLVTKIDDDNCYTIDINADTSVYTYDYSITNKDLMLSTSTTGSIIASKFSKTFTENDGDLIPWGLEDPDNAGVYPNQEAVNFAFALVVDGEAVDVFTFNAK
jgi:hypothetical protein